jgi:hypothetical protein
MFELDLDGVQEMKVDDPNEVTLDIDPLPFIVPPPPAGNSSNMVFHQTGDDDIDLLIHNKAEALYKQAIDTWTDDVYAYGETIKKYKEMGRVLPIPEYPAHPPPYESYDDHVMQTYERGMKEFKRIQGSPKGKETQPIAVAAKAKRVPTQAVASIKAKQSPKNTDVIDSPSNHPLKKTLMADIKAATAKAVNARKDPIVDGATKSKSPPLPGTHVAKGRI